MVSTSVSLGAVIKVEDVSVACGVVNGVCVLSCPLYFSVVEKLSQFHGNYRYFFSSFVVHCNVSIFSVEYGCFLYSYKLLIRGFASVLGYVHAIISSKVTT